MGIKNTSIDKRAKTMRRTGAFNIAMGVVAIVCGVTVGVGNIVCGGKLRSKAK